MKIEPIEWQCLRAGPHDECDDTCLDRAVQCPACSRSWLIDHDGEYRWNEPIECPHLRFIICDEEVVKYFNGFSESKLLAALEPAARKLSPDFAGLTVKEFFEGITQSQAAAKFGVDFKKDFTVPERMAFWEYREGKRFSQELWKLVADPRLDTILHHIDSGIACGPVSTWTFYGAHLNLPNP